MSENNTEKRVISPLDIPESIRKKCPEAQKDYEKALFKKRIPYIIILLIFIIVILLVLLQLT